jgi:hypothetical protein
MKSVLVMGTTAFTGDPQRSAYRGGARRLGIWLAARSR